MTHSPLLADLLSDLGSWTPWLMVAGLVIIVLLGMLAFIGNCLKTCPSNRVLVIYGWTLKRGGSTCKTVHGGAAFVLPIIQKSQFLSLEPIQIEIPLRGALSSENIRVNVPSVFTVAIDTKPEVMQNAAIRLLGLSSGEIRKQAEEMIFGQLRQVIASMGIEDINRDREKFLDHIQYSLEPELKKLGLQLINVNITDLTDESGYIDAIGQKAASLAIQPARGDVA
jgi:flotillin